MKSNLKFKKIKSKLMRNNIVPKSCKEISFSWIQNYNSRKYLLNRNKSSLIKFFLKGKITKKQHEIFLKINPEIVVHMAAQSKVIDGLKFPVKTFETNYMGTINVFN